MPVDGSSRMRSKRTGRDREDPLAGQSDMSQHDNTEVLEASASIFDLPPEDPIPILRALFSLAIKNQVKEPGALALATRSVEGHVSSRMVQLLDVREAGLIFTSHAQSQKGRDIAATGWASGVLYWRETQQQIIVCGPVAPLSSQESDALWAQRPVQTHAMSVASHQSEILQDEEELRSRAQCLARSGDPLARPEGWGGYALRPSIAEFWQAAVDRLHRRLRYEATPAGWTHCRLQP